MKRLWWSSKQLERWIRSLEEIVSLVADIGCVSVNNILHLCSTVVSSPLCY